MHDAIFREIYTTKKHDVVTNNFARKSVSNQNSDRILSIPNTLVTKALATCRNLPFSGRATRGSRVHLPRVEGARSRHQRLFVENVEKIEKGVVYEL